MGCADQPSGVQADGPELGLSALNGLSAINGLSAVNGLSAMNGLSAVNGLALTTGLTSSAGLASATGLMTTPMGRRTVSYLASCALGSGQSLVKADQNGKSYTFPGLVGLAPGWLTGPPSSAEEAVVSACMMARVNYAGMHVPLWLDAAPAAIGWGINSSYPAQEGAYFGNVMRASSDGTVHAWTCDGRDYLNGIVPGRLGADKTSGIYHNPWGDGALCDDHCSAHGTDGYTSCNGVSNPITVWRQASYNPVFDDHYIYKMASVRSGLSLDVAGWGTGDGTPVQQDSDNGGGNQRFQIVQVATSQWKIVDTNSGKSLASRDGTHLTLETYSGNPTDRWAIDDHNGHFILRNKANNHYLQAPSTSCGAQLTLTSSYSGAAATDWDLWAVDSL